MLSFPLTYINCNNSVPCSIYSTINSQPFSISYIPLVACLISQHKPSTCSNRPTIFMYILLKIWASGVSSDLISLY